MVIDVAADLTRNPRALCFPEVHEIGLFGTDLVLKVRVCLFDPLPAIDPFPGGANLFCRNARDYCFRPPDPDRVIGFPPVVYSTYDPILETVAPAGSAVRAQEKIDHKYGILRIDRSYIVASEFLLSREAPDWYLRDCL